MFLSSTWSPLVFTLDPQKQQSKLQYKHQIVVGGSFSVDKVCRFSSKFHTFFARFWKYFCLCVCVCVCVVLGLVLVIGCILFFFPSFGGIHFMISLLVLF
jgi:hypothetical protein